MILLPFLFGLVFFLTLTLKLLGGYISWWVVIICGALFILPIIIFIIHGVTYHNKNKNK